MNRKIFLKRVYDDYDPDDGKRILVDRLWPRGIKKENAKIDLWMKDIAPSNELRKWFHQGDKKFEDFRAKYLKELKSKEDLCKELLNFGKGKLTFLFSSKNRDASNATVLKEYLEENF